MENAKNKKAQTVTCVNKKMVGLFRYVEETNALIKESLKEALIVLLNTKDYDKISITEICQKAGVSRTAYYGNFTSKDELFKMIVLDFNQKIVEELGTPIRKETPYEWYLDLFRVMDSLSDVASLIINVGYQKKYLNILNQVIIENPNINLQKKYERLIWTGGLENAITFWLNSKKSETIENMAKYCYENLKGWELETSDMEEKHEKNNLI